MRVISSKKKFFYRYEANYVDYVSTKRSNG